MIIENKDGLTVIYAEDENKITNSQRTFFSDFIYLGKFDSVDNYEEVPRSVWKQFVKEDNPTLNGAIEDIQELQDKTNMLSETSEILAEQVTFLEESQLMSTEMTDVVMYAVAESDEKHEDMTDLLLLGISDMFTVFEPLLVMYEEQTPSVMALDLDDEEPKPVTFSNRNMFSPMVELYREIIRRELKTIDEIPERFRKYI